MQTRRTIRRINPAAHHDFDEQLWPINIALLVLCGFVGGLIIAHSEFDFARVPWYENGWVRLATLVGSVGLFVSVAVWLGGKAGRRFQLGAVISLLLHSLLGWQLYNTYLSTDTKKQTAYAVPYFAPQLVEYDYQPQAWNETAPQQEFEKPLEAQPEAQPLEVPQRVQEQPKPVEQPLPTPPENRPVPTEPQLVQRPQPELAVPKRNPEESKLSRSVTQTPPTLTEIAATPALTPQAVAPQQKLEATATPVERTTQIPQAQPKLESPAQPNPAQPQLALNTPRAEQAAPSNPATQTPQLTRAVNQPSAVPKTTVADPAALAKSQAAENPLSAAPIQLARANAAPQLNANEPPRDLAQNEVTSPSPTASRVPPTPNSSSVSRTDSPASAALARNSSSAATSTSARAEHVPAATATAGNTGNSGVGLTAPSAQPQRSLGGAPSTAVALAPNAAANADSPSANPAPTLAAARSDNATGATFAANARVNAALDGLSSRSQARNSNPAAAAITLPSVTGASGTPSNRLGGPSAVTLTRANRGFTGQSNSQNFEQSLADGSPNVRPASGASQAVATQQDSNAEAAAAPSRNALARSNVTGGEAASAPVRADDIVVPTETGSTNPSPLQASASAAGGRTSAAVPAANVTAGAGQSSADTGAPQITSAGGAASGSGGSQQRAELSGARNLPQREILGGGANPSRAELQAEDLAAGGNANGNANGGATGGSAADTQLQASATGAGRGQRGNNPAPAAKLADNGGETGGGSPGIAASGGAAVAATSTGDGPRGAATAPTLGRTGGGATGITAAQADDIGTGPSVPQNRGGEQGTPFEAFATGTGKTTVGLPGPTSNVPLGAAAGEAIVDAPSAPAISGNGARGATATTSGATATGSATTGALARSTGAPTSAAGEAADLPALPAGNATGAPNVGTELQAGLTSGATGLSRGGVKVELAALTDTGGLGDHYSPRVGTHLPQARTESDVISNTPARFLNRTSGGITAVDGQIREPSPAFKKRGRVSNLEPEILLGLEFLAKSQDGNGRWSLQLFPAATAADIGNTQSDTAATGLALLAFLGAGYDHYGEEYQQNVARGLRFLVERQKANGDLFADPPATHCLYSHAIATIALCEAYGMTGDEKLREPAQKALDYIVAAQNKQLGGWRYRPQDSLNDTSVTGWQVMALKSGELAKLKVDPEVYVGVNRWLESARAKSNAPNVVNAKYVYNPFSDPKTNDYGRDANPATTSMGLLMRMYLDAKTDSPELRAGSEYLLQNLPEYGNAVIGRGEFRKRDTYYWYYATQVMFHLKGEAWQQWNAKLRPLLVQSQLKTGPQAGSWEPNGPIPDRWSNSGGRIYVTAMNLLSLEVTHRYLPIYELGSEPPQTAKRE